MTSKQIIEELKKAGSATTKATLEKHGAKGVFFGTKVADIKKIIKKVDGDRQALALEIYATGIADAQYMAGLMADGTKMTKKQLQEWAENASWEMIGEFSVPWVSSENKDGFELALKWIDSKKPAIASTGWATLSNIITSWPDEKIDMETIGKLLKRIEKEIEKAPNRVRYCMNSFVIATGSYIKAQTKNAVDTGKKIGVVEVDMGGTACKVPFAPDYISKAIERGTLTKKKKTVKC